MNPFRSLTLVGWIGLGIAVAVILTLAIWWAGGGARRDAAVARTGAALAGARAASGAEATETIARGADRDAATDATTQENAHAIDNAPGAGQRLDPALSRAGADSLCKRAAYRGSAQCVQRLGPVQPPDPGPRR